MTFKALILNLRAASLSPRPRVGNRANQARVNTARCEERECRDWCTVILCRRAVGFALAVLSVGVGSSKNFRQSSSSASSSSSSGSSSGSSSSVDPPLTFDFFLGLEPSSETHHSLSSACSVGNVVRRSRMESRLAEDCGLFEDCRIDLG